MSLDGKRVLITGGAGFIGSELVRLVGKCAADVVVVDNLVNGKRENLDEVLSDRVRLETVDIRDRERMQSLLRGVDVVFHLACLGVRHSIHSPNENHEVNATAALNLLQDSRKAEVSRFVHVSTSEIYGTARTVPMTEEHPAFPHTVYGAAKLAGECYARAFYDTYRYPTVVVRPFNSYGPRSHHEGDSGEVIPKFMLRAMAGQPLVVFGDGKQTRDFTYVSDTARGILLAATSDRAVGQTINVGSQMEITVSELADEVRRVVGRADLEVVHDDPRPGDTLRLYADSRLARELLGFTPELSLAEGLTKLHDWYLASGVDATELLKQEVTHNWESKEAGR